MNYKQLLLFASAIFLFSCEKPERNCSDGIFDAAFEEQTDCGKQCPPCDFSPTPVDSYLSATINGKKTDFSSFSIMKNTEYKLLFNNDTVNVVMNLGASDTIGDRVVEPTGSFAYFRGLPYETLISASAVVSEVDSVEGYFSGYFRAKYLSNNGFDTLFITSGEFKKAEW